MTTVITSVLIVTIIGIIAGVGLSVASVIMKVPVDEKQQKIREALPGANCGACGFSGCDGYAAALSQGKTDNTGLCAPGGQAAADKIAEILGVSACSALKPAAPRNRYSRVAETAPTAVSATAIALRYAPKGPLK